MSLIPLLYLHIHLGNGEDNFSYSMKVEESLNSLPCGKKTSIVSGVRFFATSNSLLSQKVVKLHLYNRQSLSMGRDDIATWLMNFPDGSVFVVLEGHAIVSSGELLW